MKILAFDSSSVTLGAALVSDGRTVAEVFGNLGLTHSQTLMPAVKNLLDMTGTPLSEVDLFAITRGPGSFTGLRIALSAAKGMAAASGKPCIGVSTLAALAHNLPLFRGIICAAMDARRSQVYTALFEGDGKSKITRLTEDTAIPLNELEALLAAAADDGRLPIIFVGDGAALCYNEMKTRMPGALLAPERLLYVKASSVAAAAADSPDFPLGVDPGELSPVYLRRPQAERVLEEKTLWEKAGK